MTIVRTLAAAAMLASATCGLAVAQTAPPDQGVSNAFAEANRHFICPAGDLSHAALLSEIANNYDLNPYALAPVPADGLSGRFAQPAPGPGRLAAWIVAAIEVSTPDAVASGLTRSQKHQLEEISRSFDVYLAGVEEGRGGPYRTTSPRTSESEDRVLRFFAPVLNAPDVRRLDLVCTPGPVPNGPGEAQGRREQRGALTIALRGRINDLAVQRTEGGAEISAAFKKASEATFAFTDNREKGEEAFAIEAAIGMGYSLTQTDALFGFVHYVQNTTETDVSGDDDDAKDIQALSPGILWRRSARFGSLAGTLGATVYPTFDFAQDAQTERARLFLSDIAFRAGNAYICDAELIAGPLLLKCRLGAALEYAHVTDAGTSADLATLEDDEYLGIGGELGVIVGFHDIQALRPLEFSIDYRTLSIVDGGMSDPERLTASLSYRIPDSFISVGLSYVQGENFETFQHEDQLKFAVGLRY